MKFLVIPMMMAISGCQGIVGADDTARNSVEYTCASATAALKTAIAFNDKLTATQRATVTQATVVINPVCSQEAVPTLGSTASAALTAALAQLTTVAIAVSPK